MFGIVGRRIKNASMETDARSCWLIVGGNATLVAIALVVRFFF